MKNDYCYVKNLYTPDECAEIRKVLESNVFKQAVDYPADRSVKTSDVSLIKFGDAKHVLEKFHNYCLNINQKMFGFDLFQLNDLDLMNYNTYKVGGEYSWHRDGEKNEPFDLKLTAILDLSPGQYTGGEFSLFLDSPCVIDQFKGTGSMIIFPSWIVHKVSPVTSGERVSLAHFLSGPLLK